MADPIGVELSAALRQILERYTAQTAAIVDQASAAAMKTLVKSTKDTAPRSSFAAESDRRYVHYYTSITFKKMEGTPLGTSRYLWYVKRPNVGLTHLLVHGHAPGYHQSRAVAGNDFLLRALDTVTQQYEADLSAALRSGKGGSL